MTNFERGDKLRLRNASGQWIDGRALSRPEEGIVWVCAERDWESMRDGPAGNGVPWPIEDAVAVSAQPA